jgi:hypothetical protein
MTSEAQRAANQRNAQKSTGPRTEEGKARSSANSLKHGAYSGRQDIITSSILAEDPEEVIELVTDIIDELDPQTALEAAAAHTVALRVLNRLRANRLLAPLAHGVAPAYDNRYTIGTARNEVRVGEETLRAIDVIEGIIDEPVDWLRLIIDLNRIVTPATPFDLMQTWPNGERRAPVTEDEWRFKFEDLMLTSFADYDEARTFASSWSHRHAPDASVEHRAEEATQARQLLEDFERTTRIADHVDRGFDRAMASFEKMRARTDREQGDPRNEPNP